MPLRLAMLAFYQRRVARPKPCLIFYFLFPFLVYVNWYIAAVTLSREILFWPYRLWMIFNLPISVVLSTETIY